MFKKILVGGFLLLMAGAVVAGAFTLFAQRSGFDAHAGSNGKGQGALARQGTNERGGPRELTSQNSYGKGQGLGRRQGPSTEPQPENIEWQTIEGVVVETEEVVIATALNETVQVGMGPSHYRDAQGFVLAVGNRVQVSGYWESGEFKAAEVENLDTGDRITLRNASGRPMWAGQGRGQGRG